jgi:hypothetical protein
MNQLCDATLADANLSAMSAGALPVVSIASFAQECGSS